MTDFSSIISLHAQTSHVLKNLLLHIHASVVVLHEIQALHSKHCY